MLSAAGIGVSDAARRVLVEVLYLTDGHLRKHTVIAR